MPGDAAAAARLCAALGAGEPIGDDVTLVISTSGSTGIPKGAQHTAATLRASARATEAFLGGPGNWLLTLPPHHIAGLQVLLRAIGAGYRPRVIDVRDGFGVDDFVRSTGELDGVRRYTSLVPTQLIKVLASPAATDAARTFDAILVGGAATPELLRRKAIDEGLAIVCTYGMSETAGGCVYDGFPLDGVEVRIEGDDQPLNAPAYLVMSKHSSHFDLLGIFAKMPIDMRPVAKRELGRIPIFGWVLRAGAAIMIDRGDREKAKASIARAGETIRGGRSVLLFPEGTRSAPDHVAPLKKGPFHLAAEARVPILPVAVIGSA